MLIISEIETFEYVLKGVVSDIALEILSTRFSELTLLTLTGMTERMPNSLSVSISTLVSQQFFL
jgi:hypothetical protein